MIYTKREETQLAKAQADMDAVCKKYEIKAFKNPEQTGLIFDLNDDGLLKADFYFGEGIEWKATGMSIRREVIRKALEKSVSVVFAIMNRKVK